MVCHLDPTALATGTLQTPTGNDPDYWHGLIDQGTAASFLDVVPRTLEIWRQRGGGPRYRLLSSRCVKYTRADLKAWAESKIRTSTSDTGEDLNAA